MKNDKVIPLNSVIRLPPEARNNPKLQRFLFEVGS